VALYSLANLNVAMYSILKRGFILLVLIGETYYLNTAPSATVVLSIAAMILGTVLAGLGDLDYSFYGYSMSCMEMRIEIVYLSSSVLSFFFFFFIAFFFFFFFVLFFFFVFG
jgi:hypothetical protein